MLTELRCNVDVGLSSQSCHSLSGMTRVPGSKQMPSSPHGAAAHLVHRHARRPSKHSKLHPAHACDNFGSLKPLVGFHQTLAHLSTSRAVSSPFSDVYTPCNLEKIHEKGIFREIHELSWTDGCNLVRWNWWLPNWWWLDGSSLVHWCPVQWIGPRNCPEVKFPETCSKCRAWHLEKSGQ